MITKNREEIKKFVDSLSKNSLYGIRARSISVLISIDALVVPLDVKGMLEWVKVSHWLL